jgi:hypothetical protein
MEGVVLVLIGAALFSQSWYVLGFYSEGRTMGVFVGGLGLLSLATIMFGPTLEPTLLTEVGKKVGGAAKVISDSDVLAEVTVMKSVIIVWALYAIGVGAHGLWDFDERAIGFYSAVVAAVTAVAFLYFAIELETRYTSEVWLSLSGATFVLTVIAGIMFFYLAFALNVLRLVAGWFTLLGGGVVAAIGLAIVGAAVT